MMAMRFRYFIYILLVLTLSCVKEQEALVPEGTVTATIPYRVVVQGSQPTRASISDDFGTGSYIFQEGDRLFVVDADTDGANLYGVLTLVDGAGYGSGTFEGSLNCIGGFFPTDLTELSATLVGPDAELYTISDDKIADTAYPSSIAYEAGGLVEYVKKYSHFTSSSTFGNKSFTLTQQTIFLNCAIKDVPKSILADPTETSVIIKKGEFVRTFTGIPLGSGTYLGDISFIGIFSSAEDISSGEIWVEDVSNDKNHCLPDFSSTLSLQANNYYAVNRKATEWEGFKIKAKDAGTEVTFQFSSDEILGVVIQYSLDNGRTWTVYNEVTPITIGSGESICWKGNRTEYNCRGDKQLFTANHLCYISGNITSLLLDPNTLNANAFRSAFSYGLATDANAELEKNIPVPQAPNPTTVNWVDIDPENPLILPASTAANCYMEMFMGCTSLKSAPDLPATELADKCYFRMFYNTGLSSIPTFPSTVEMEEKKKKRHRHFFQMFQSCTGIKKLEGSLFGETTTLKDNCFEDMFSNCTGLTYVAPGFLPATTLAKSCYRGMFQSTAITSAPELPAETLVSECYRFMFNNCKKLTYIKCLATTNVGINGYTTNWVGSVNASGTFVKDVNTTWPINTSTNQNTHGIPKDWGVENYPPTP